MSADSDPVRVLGATPLFAALGERELAAVAGACVRRGFAKGEFLFRQGEPGDWLYIVVSGLVKVQLTSEQGNQLVLATLGGREVLGELAVLDRGPRSASAVAVRPSSVLALSRPVLLRLLAAHPGVLNALLTSLGALVRRLTEQTGDLVFLDLGARLAKLLLRLAEQRGRTELDLGLTQTDLAGMVGASRPPVNRGLRDLAGRGLIELAGQRIILRDLAGLRRRAEG